LTSDIDYRYRLAMAKPTDLLQGTLDLLILRTLELQPLHGVGIADRIEQVTRGVFVVGPGSLFPALHRLAEKGWIAGEWGPLPTGRRAKFYALTRAGRSQLAREKRNWLKVNAAVNQVLAPSEGEG
jgi:PadR family transcriptional regulator PadR